MIPFRLRVPIYLKTRDQWLTEATYGIELPAERIPPRTTLRIVDLFSSGAYALLPDGRGVHVSYETARKHGYVPRKERRT